MPALRRSFAERTAYKIQFRFLNANLMVRDRFVFHLSCCDRSPALEIYHEDNERDNRPHGAGNHVR